MRMAQGLDAGPVYRAARTPIEPSETAGQLTARLAELGAVALMQVIDRFDELVPAPQDESQATWARPLVKADGKIDWSRSASELHNLVRALNPWPSAQTAWGDLVLKIHTSKPQSNNGRAGEPGTVLEVSAAGIDVACGQGVLRLAALQAPGKKSLCAADFLRGTRIEKGALFI
jgi:methionyl-tRNA formyltransferase